MNPLLKEIFSTRQIADESGNIYKLRASIDPPEGEFISSLIDNHPINHSLEIGCAYGLASLAICDALSRKESPHHVIIDPYQTEWWHRIGVNNLKKANFHFFELLEKPSELGLPALLEEGRSFDFALIDGWHTFDHTLLDFFYINRLLKPGGIVVIDDVYFPSINKAARYISNYPCYQLLGSVRTDRSWKRQTVHRAKQVVGLVPNMFAHRYMQEIFDDSILRSDLSLNLDSSMIAFQKVAEDERNWDWFVDF